jgi:alkanesulfonate monooxygenase SsuD/methylene tetrahydromethanopterin reductase-like flavin-dependent oxidoreductase (luciferase family)
MGRNKALQFLDKLKGVGFAKPNPSPMFPNPPGLLRLEPHSEGLRERIWWGAASNATAVWAAENGMHLQSSTLKFDESGKPFHVQQAEQIRLYKEAWRKAGHQREPRVSVSRSIFALITDEDRYFTLGRKPKTAIASGILKRTNAPFSEEAMPGNRIRLIRELAQDEAIQEADTLLLTIPNTLGVDYNVHVLSSILKHVAPGLGWR